MLRYEAAKRLCPPTRGTASNRMTYAAAQLRGICVLPKLRPSKMPERGTGVCGALVIGLIRAKGFGWVDGSGAPRGKDSGNAGSQHEGRNRKSHNGGGDAGDFKELGFDKANA